MLFNSWIFVLFFFIVYSLYRVAGRSRVAQNLILLVASYVFYGWWNWKFLGLILLSTAIDYVAALKISTSEDPRTRKLWLMLSVGSNLLILGTFKYFNFFLENLESALTGIGLETAMPSLSLVLPVGISFYTFQSMSYTIDVYRGKTEACRNFPDFALYVAFFPQLVAGPIERSSTLLGQIRNPRKVTRASTEAGIWLIVWGLFKKVVVADNAAMIADPIFTTPGDHSGAQLIIGALAFTAQIYGDFSGYSDMARGLSKMLGFDLMLNFRLPYFAVSPSDFWQRWHISLSTWLRDYLYISLGGNRGGTLFTYRNLVLTMLLGGLWHGAQWNFIVWGAYHGFLLVVYKAVGDRVSFLPKNLWGDSIRAAVMFVFTVIGWIIFRVESLSDLWVFAVGIGKSAETFPELSALVLAAVWLPVLVIQIGQLVANDLLAPLRLPAVARGILLGLLLATSLAFATGKSIEFIYFQF